MAQVEVTKMLDGPRNAAFHIFISGDGSGDAVDVVIIDPATDFDPVLPASPGIKLQKIWHDLQGFSVFFEYEYLASDTPLWTITDNGSNCLDFSCFGGITDRSDIDGSGKIKLTTSGLELGELGTIILHIIKA